jgi:hypothetical protein
VVNYQEDQTEGVAMKKLLLATLALVALSLPMQAAQFDVGINPTSVTGNFSFTPGAVAFEDQAIFTLAGGPAYVSIANATNTFAGPGDEILNWVASIFSAGLDQIVNNGDDVLLFGPQNASACVNVSNCQAVGGSGIINTSGIFYAEFTGTGSGTSGYSGNISTFAVPGPVVGAGLPAMLAFGLLGLSYFRRRRTTSVLA